MTNKKKSFNEYDIKAFESVEKVGIVASIDLNGLPHISILTSIMAKDSTHMTVGQFCKGLSKWYMKKNKNTAFIILTLDKKMWRGRAKWTHLANEGPEYEIYNDMPMFRYNAYFGIDTVHYLDLVDTTDREGLPLFGIIRAALLTTIGRGGAATGIDERILKPFAQNLFNRLDSLKFISYIGEDGFPVLIPAIQCQAADSRRLVFSPSVYGEDLKAIPEGSTIAVLGMNFQMQSVLARGTFLGVKRYRAVRLGAVDINWVYNSMPPCHGQIYPEVEIEPVVNF